MSGPFTRRSEHACFGGTQGFYQHLSVQCAGPMRFAVYVPAMGRAQRLPAVYCLAGLTCTEETFTIKAGAQRIAAELGLILVMPDTSPREPLLPGDREHWDFGQGAGFYLDAIQEPWSRYYRMFSWICEELPTLIDAHFPTDPSRRGICGHSMGGHGALVSALRRPDVFHSCSAFAPIAAPTQCPWGHKAFGHYLGSDRSSWADYDASALMRTAAFPREILIDQGLADSFLQEQLLPEHLEAAAAESGQALRLRRHAGYDHGYYFIQSFVA
ncbi:MAG: S-formylglutathione hydrolase, partial [Gammaproteobacteria bacterium]|nr:S-formylglutathione hydrolase [Gammaproteobacteria bacterium]